MKNLKKLLVVFFFTVAVSLFALAYSASAATVKYSVDGGYIYFNTSSGAIIDADSWVKVVNIPEQIDGVDVVSINSRAFYSSKALTTVTLPDTVVTICDYAFAFCNSLRNITIPDNVTSIGNSAFTGCEVLEKINIPDGVTSIGSGAFGNCESLSAITIPDSVISIGESAFYNCRLIKEVILPDSVTDLGESAFGDCFALANVRLSKNISVIPDSLFENCIKLSSIDITSNITGIGSEAFLYCTSLESVTIPSTVKSIGNLAFSECSALKSVTISEGVETIGGHAFDSCKELARITIPGSVKELGSYSFQYTGIKNVTLFNGIQSISEKTFSYCTSLTEVVLPESITYVDSSAFAGCSSLLNVEVDDNNTVYCDVDGVLFNKDVSAVCTYPAGRQGVYIMPDTVTKVENYAFYRCVGLTDIVFSDNLETIGDYSFYDARIDRLVFPDSLKTIGDAAFQQDWGSKGGSFVKLNNGLESIGFAAFSNCDASEIIVPDSVTSVRAYSLAFSNLNSAVLGKGLTKLNDEVFGSGHLSKLVINNNLTSIYRNYMGHDRIFEDLEIDVVYVTCSESEWEATGRDFDLISSPNVAYNYIIFSRNVVYNYVMEEPGKIKYDILGEDSTVKITGANNIDFIRYAPGKLNSLSEIKSTAGMVTINPLGIVENTTNGTYTREIPIGGTYSFWIRFTDGSTVIEHIELSQTKQRVSINGLHLTVHNLDGVKDFFIAKGTYNTYRELKPHNIMRIPEAKINGANEYTYTVNQPGEYTVCVRFNDGSENLILYATATAELPEFETDGLALVVDGLKDIRVIRTAPGVWNSPAEVKRAAGCRNITANTIGNTDSYTVYYPESGTYTVTLEYTNGLVVVEHIELTATEPTLVQDGNSVVIGNLDNLYTIRYAKGEYATMSEIKRAEGCQIRRSRDIKNGVITVDGLEPGTYTFCVQYNDQSYNYFTVVVE